MRRLALRLLAVALLIVGASVAAFSDKPQGMPAEVVGGLLLLALTVIGVEWALSIVDERRQASELSARWDGLGGVPFRSLAAAVADIVDALAWLLTGHHPFGRPLIVDPAASKKLETLLRRSVGDGRTPIPPRGQCRLFDERLHAVLTHPSWCDHAVLCIDLVKWEFRERIGLWAAPMLDRAELARVLTRFSELDSQIGRLQQPLREIAQYPDEPAPPEVSAVADLWFETLAEAVSIREDLMRAALPVHDQTRDAVKKELAAFPRHRYWLREDARLRLVARADGADASLGDDDARPPTDGQIRTWRLRRQQLLATPASPDETNGLLHRWDRPTLVASTEPRCADPDPSTSADASSAEEQSSSSPTLFHSRTRIEDSDLEEMVLRGPMVDSHEHLLTNAELQRQKPDALVDLFAGYPSSDLISAGASKEAVTRLLDSSDPDLGDRFEGVAAIWPDCRHTGFGQATAWIAKYVYGLDELTVDTVATLNGTAPALRSPSHRIDVLRDQALLDHVQIDDLHWRCAPDTNNPEFFLHDISWLLFAGGDVNTRLDVGGTGRDFAGVSEAAGVEISDLPALTVGMEWVVDTFAGVAVALKSQHAYVRGLAYRPRSDDEARRALNSVLTGAASDADKACLGDWALAHGARLAGEHHLPFKLHTGYLAGNEGMALDELRPAHLAPLIQSFPGTRFVLMHTAYPFAGEALALSKHHPNVYLDWCWAWSLDPHQASLSLRRALHTVPVTKLLLFGGDAGHAHAAWAYSEQARRGLLSALREEIRDELLTLGEACRVAERLLCGNHMELFDVDRAKSASSRLAAALPTQGEYEREDGPGRRASRSSARPAGRGRAPGTRRA